MRARPIVAAMRIDQRIRRWLRGAVGRRAPEEGPSVEPVQRAAAPKPERLKVTPEHARRGLKWGAIGLGVVLLLYYPLGSILDHRINDDASFSVPDPGAGRSWAVATAAALIKREVDDTGWVANTPYIAPNALLKFGGNMVNFQSGMVYALGVFSVEMRDQIGRARGGSPDDPDLKTAAGLLQYEPEIWVLRWGQFWPTTPADDQYRKARRSLIAYNDRLARGEATFDARADNLIAVLNRMALDLGAASADLEAQIDAGRRVIIDRRADKLLYNVKGRSYGYLMVLKGLRVDFADVIETKNAAGLYDEMLTLLEKAATIKPLMTQNGAPEGVLANNHLAVQGFYLLRARTRMREITDILAK